MARIRKAAKWMGEGKRVRRQAWNSGETIGPKSYRMDVVDQNGVSSHFLVEDLLADDWELAE